MFFSVLRSGRAVSGVAALVVAATLPVAVARVAAQAPAAQPPAAQQPPATTAPKADAPKPDTANLPPAREIIDRFVKLLGGRDAILAHKSMHITGTYEVASAGLTGTLEIFTATNPNRSVQKVVVPGVGEITQGFDGERGWSVNPMTGPMLQQGKELEQARADADFYGELRDAKNYKSITTVEKGPFEGKTCYKIRLVRNDGSEDFDYYDVETGMRAGSVQTRDTPMGTISSTNVDGAYKKFGDLLQPSSMTAKAMGVEQKITVTAVEYDSVPASAFEPPAAIKALIK